MRKQELCSSIDCIMFTSQSKLEYFNGLILKEVKKSLWLNIVGPSGITTGISALLQKSSCAQGHGTSAPPGSRTEPAS